MLELPGEVTKITSSCIKIDGKRECSYKIYGDGIEENKLDVVLPKFGRYEITNEIIDENKKFVNGFKVVKMDTLEYAYLREDDSKLLPFRYDLALDFNEYGFAMVGKDGRVSWIDKDFRYLDRDGEMSQDECDPYDFPFYGWNEVSRFSKGDIPLSRLMFEKFDQSRQVSYFGIDGKIKTFDIFDSFQKGIEFDRDGMAVADDLLLFANGNYLEFAKVMEICKQEGLKDMLNVAAKESSFENREVVYMKK